MLVGAPVLGEGPGGARSRGAGWGPRASHCTAVPGSTDARGRRGPEGPPELSRLTTLPSAGPTCCSLGGLGPLVSPTVALTPTPPGGKKPGLALKEHLNNEGSRTP